MASQEQESLGGRPAAIKAFSGFPSAQLETYYHRIHLKMVEFLADFVMQCLSKDLCGCAKTMGGLVAEISRIPAGIHPEGESLAGVAPTEAAPLKAANLD